MQDIKNRRETQAPHICRVLEPDPTRRTSPIRRKATPIYEPDSAEEVSR